MLLSSKTDGYNLTWKDSLVIYINKTFTKARADDSFRTEDKNIPQVSSQHCSRADWRLLQTSELLAFEDGTETNLHLDPSHLLSVEADLDKPTHFHGDGGAMYPICVCSSPHPSTQ